MDVANIANIVAMVLYATVWVHLMLATVNQRAANTRLITTVTALALLAHGLAAHNTIFVATGIRIGIAIVPTLLFWVMNLLVLLSGLRRPLHNLFLFLLPLSVLAIVLSMLADSDTTQIERGLAGHIILSMLAYSLLAIATLQALLLAYLNRKLKHKHSTNLMRILPPLETMDALMFDLIWAGQGVLTFSIITGVVFVPDITTFFSSHHAVISLIAWLIYAILLWGHWQWGWRGKTAVRWAVGGFTALLLAYFGTKFAYEVVFHKSQIMQSSQAFID